MIPQGYLLHVRFRNEEWPEGQSEQGVVVGWLQHGDLYLPVVAAIGGDEYGFTFCLDVDEWKWFFINSEGIKAEADNFFDLQPESETTNVDPYAEPVPEDWETAVNPNVAQLFKVLREYGGQTGLTKAEARRRLPLSRGLYEVTWARLQEKRSPSGDPIMINVSGNRWTVDEQAMREATAA